MPLIKEIEGALPLIATLPEAWQKDIALTISKFVIAYDKSLTMTPEAQKAGRDREIACALDMAHRRSSSAEPEPTHDDRNSGKDGIDDPAG